MNIISTLSPKQKGEIIENRVAEIITLSSKGQLSSFMPIVDDDGLDLVVCPKGEFKPLFIQIKSRFNLQKNKSYIHNVGLQTFKANKHFYLLFVLFDLQNIEIVALWLVPSLAFKENAVEIKEGETFKGFYRFTASPTSNKDKWSKYRIDKTEIAAELTKIIKATYS